MRACHQLIGLVGRRGRFAGLVFPLLLAVVSCAPFPGGVPGGFADYSPASWDVVKVDPEPVAPNQSFDLVVEVVSRVDRPLTVSLDASTDSVTIPLVATLGPKESKVFELHGLYFMAGPHQAEVRASWQTDQWIWVVVGPGQLERRPQFKSLGSRFADIQVTTTPLPRPRWVDLGPEPRRKVDGGASAAGVIGALEGSTARMFAVSKAAGIWRSLNQQPWQQLPNSPPRAFSLAIDPTGQGRLFAGEREDDTSDKELGRSGLWRSLDDGVTWARIYDPLADTGSQAIPSMAVAPSTGTLVFATQRGVGRMAFPATTLPAVTYATRNNSDSDCGSTASEMGLITAVTASAHRIWARSRSELFFSDDDGRTFACRKLPTDVNLPGLPHVRPVYDTIGSVVGGEDSLSLAAFDDRAYIIFQPVVSPSDPRSTADQECDPTDTDNYNPAKTDCAIANVSPLLTFAVRRRPSATTESWTAQNTRDNDGRGGNGRRLVRTLEMQPGQCPSIRRAGIGGRRQLAYVSAQSAQLATNEMQDGTLNFLAPTYSDFLRPHPAPPPPGRYAPMHADLWDVLIPSDYCPAGNDNMFIANDGGVYRGTLTTDLDWVTRSEGLRTHTVQGLALNEIAAAPRTGRDPILQLGYATMDNEGWWRSPTGVWKHTDNLGDANFAVADRASGSIWMWRNFVPANASIISGATATNLSFNNPAQPFDGPLSIEPVQSLASEPGPKTDMAMLIQLPIMDSEGNPIAGPLGMGTQRDAIIRNRDFESNPDAPAAAYAGWSIVIDNLPAGARRFWVSGGHDKANFYLLTDGRNANCAKGVARWRFFLAVQQWGWQCLITGLAMPDSRNFVAGPFGPFFVNPYDPNIMFAERPDGIQVSTDAGANFCPLPLLTGLVTAGGRYRVQGTFHPGGTYTDLGSRYHGLGYGVPAQVSFDRRNPEQFAVASPYGGIFLGRLPAGGPVCTSPGWTEPAWRDASPYLPRPVSYIGDVALVGNGAIVGTRGRGAFALADLGLAPVASLFQPSSAAPAGSPIARLVGGDGQPLAWSRVFITILAAADRTTVASRLPVRTDADGMVPDGSALGAGNYIVTLTFAGEAAHAPTDITFKHQVQ